MRNFKKMYVSKNRTLRSFKPIGVVLHETATQGAPAINEYNYFNNNDVGVCAHAFIDWREDIQTVPWDELAWHCKTEGNKRFIGVEMCRPKDTDKMKLDKMNITYLSSVNAVARIFRYILNIKTITKDNLMSHDEVRLKWNQTTHTDPTEYLNEINRNMNMFRSDVQKELDRLYKK